MTALAYLVVAIIIYFLGVARGHLLAEQDAGRLGTGPVRFDAWEEEPGTGGADPAGCFAEGYRAGVRFERFRAEQDAARSPGVRERAMAEAVGGREVERGKVLG